MRFKRLPALSYSLVVVFGTLFLLASGRNVTFFLDDYAKGIKISYDFLLRNAIEPVAAVDLLEASRVGLNSLVEEPFSFDNSGQDGAYLDTILADYRQVAKTEIGEKKAYQAVLEGMLKSLNDKYARYFDDSAKNEITDLAYGSFGGVGLYINAKQDEQNNKLVEVAGIIEGGSAQKVGILPGDNILAIDGQKTQDLDLLKVQKLIRGKVGSSVKLLLGRGEAHNFERELIRKKIEIPTVESLFFENNIAYIRVLQFTPFTAQRFLDDFYKLSEEQQVNGLILDLRNNPGGLLDAAVKLSDYFIKEGIIVFTKSRLKNERRTFKANSQQQITAELPLVVLINGNTASAAEIVAGALRDQRQAYLIGEQSYGKGTVQQPLHLPIGLIRITVARYYTPEGVNLAGHGLEPDLHVQSFNTQALSPAEQKSVLELQKKELLSQFLLNNPQPDEEKLNIFYQQLLEQGNTLTYDLFKYLLKIELESKIGREISASVLQYDQVFQEAIRYLDQRRLSVEN